MFTVASNDRHLRTSILLVLCVIAHVVKPSPLCNKSATKTNERIYFPDMTYQSSGNGTNECEETTQPNLAGRSTAAKVVPDVSRCALENETFCTNDTSYPLDLINSILRDNLSKYADFFRSDTIPLDVGNRDSMDTIELCDTYTEVIYPQSGENEKGAKLYIFNTNDHKQGIRVSMCRKSGKACNSILNVPNDHRTECRQDYVYHELLSLSPEKVAIREAFKFPTCCSCQVIRT